MPCQLNVTFSCHLMTLRFVLMLLVVVNPFEATMSSVVVIPSLAMTAPYKSHPDTVFVVDGSLYININNGSRWPFQVVCLFVCCCLCVFVVVVFCCCCFIVPCLFESLIV